MAAAKRGSREGAASGGALAVAKVNTRHYFVGTTDRCKRCNGHREARGHVPDGHRSRPMSVDRMQRILAAPAVVHDLRTG